jgi:release factor glutamine methyltransferase
MPVSSTRTRPDDAPPFAVGVPGAVYPLREDSLLLLPYARVAPGTSLLEVGTGRGLAALTAARAGARVVATDLNPHALRALRATARSERLDLLAVRTDLADGLGRFDRILSNPPYLPTAPVERDPDRWHDLALNGGPDGCRVLARLLQTLPEHLAPNGEAYVVTSSLQSATRLAAIRRRWTSMGGRVEGISERALEGERLEVWRLSRGSLGPRTSAPGRRGPAPLPGSGVRPQIPRDRPGATSRAPERGRTRAPGEA